MLHQQLAAHRDRVCRLEEFDECSPMQQQLDALCVRDNSPSTAYGNRYWRCSTCQRPFSRGKGHWVDGKTREECARELHELGRFACLDLFPRSTATTAEVCESIMALRGILKNGNDASFHFCGSACYWTWMFM